MLTAFRSRPGFLAALLDLALFTSAAATCFSDDLAITVTAEYDSLEPGALITYTIQISTTSFGLVTVLTSTDVGVRPSPNTFVPDGSDAAWEERKADEETGLLPLPLFRNFSFVRNLSFGGRMETKRVLTMVVRVNAVPADADAVTLTASLIRIDNPFEGFIRGRDDDDNSNNTASLDIPVIDVGVTTETLSGDPSDPTPDELITYQHTVTNHRAFAVDTILTNVVPAGATFVAAGSDADWTCDDGAAAGTVCRRPVSLAAADLTTAQTPDAEVAEDILAEDILFVVRVVADHPAGEPIRNVATLPTKGDTNPTDNRSPALDLAISVTQRHGPLGPEDRITYTIAIDNPDPVEQTVTVRSTPDANTTFVAVDSDDAWVAGPEVNEFRVPVPAVQEATVTVPAGGSRVLTLVVSVPDLPALVPPPDELTLSARLLDAVGNPRVDGDNTNNDATISIPVIDVALATVLQSREPLGFLTYRHTVTNKRGAAVEIVLTNIVPLDTAFAFNQSSPGWDCAPRALGGRACTLALSLGGAGAHGLTVASCTQDVTFAVVILRPLSSGVEPIPIDITNHAALSFVGDTDDSDNATTVVTRILGGPPLPTVPPGGGGMGGGGMGGGMGCK